VSPTAGGTADTVGKCGATCKACRLAAVAQQKRRFEAPTDRQRSHFGVPMDALTTTTTTTTAKIKSMIKDLIVKLMEEANAEADQHAFCQTELATNKQTREIKSEEADELTAELESQNALLEKLATEIAQLSDEVAEIKRQQNGATDNRLAEKKTNTATIADAKVAQAAVEKATTVLKEFYSANAAGSALLQDTAGLKQEMQQAASLDPYSGQQAGSGGIMGMMEVILSDFARLETETQESENSAASTYETFMNESNEDVAVKETEIEHKSNKKDTCTETIAELN